MLILENFCSHANSAQREEKALATLGQVDILTCQHYSDFVLILFSTWSNEPTFEKFHVFV